jgi:hypothetical protein
MYNTKPNNLKKIYNVLEKYELEGLLLGGIELDDTDKVKGILQHFLKNNVLNEILNLMIPSDKPVDYEDTCEMIEIIEHIKNFFSFIKKI